MRRGSIVEMGWWGGINTTISRVPLAVLCAYIYMREIVWKCGGNEEKENVKRICEENMRREYAKGICEGKMWKENVKGKCEGEWERESVKEMQKKYNRGNVKGKCKRWTWKGNAKGDVKGKCEEEYLFIFLNFINSPVFAE
jgi:hypothetical protein